MSFIFSRAFWREFRFAALLALLLGLLGIQRCADTAPARPDGFRPVGDTRQVDPATEPAPVVRLVSQRLLLDQLRDTSTSAQPNLGRKANPRSRWHLVPGPAYLVYPLPRPRKQSFLDAEAARAAQLHKI